MQVGARADKMSTRILRIMSVMREGAGVNYVWWKKGRGIVPPLLALEAFMKGGSYDDQVVTRWEGTFGKVSYTREGALYREAVRVYLMSDEGGVVQAWVVSCPPSSVPLMNDTSDNGMTEYIWECIYNNPSPKGGILLVCASLIGEESSYDELGAFQRQS